MSGSAAAADRCPLCGGGERALAVIGYDRQWPRRGDFVYHRCGACGLLAQSPLPEEEAIAGFYPDAYPARLEEREPNLDKVVNRWAIAGFYGVGSGARPGWRRAVFRALSGRILRDALEPHGDNRLLDVGCGGGALLALHRRLGWTVAGVEPHPRAAARCRARGLPVHAGSLADAPDWGPFDVVLLSHVLEHVRDPLALLQQAAARLAVGGRIVVVTPNARALGLAWFGSAWFALEAPRHLMLFDSHTIRKLAADAGLRVGALSTRGDRGVLCASRQYARTQGAILPEDPEARAAAVARAWDTPRRDRGFRALVGVATGLAALVGRGETLVAELWR